MKVMFEKKQNPALGEVWRLVNENGDVLLLPAGTFLNIEVVCDFFGVELVEKLS